MREKENGGPFRGRRPDSDCGSVHCDTFVFTLLVLFPDIGSLGDVDVTIAVFVKMPFFVGFSIMLIVTVAPFDIVPMSQTTFCVCGLGAQVPCVELTEPNPVFFGMVSVTVTPLAACEPLFFTVIT
jgi:hypothetical protein